MIRINAIWLATDPMDMRAGTDTALAPVVAVFGAAQPHCAYLFANRRANRLKVLVHDGLCYKALQFRHCLRFSNSTFPAPLCRKGKVWVTVAGLC